MSEPKTTPDRIALIRAHTLHTMSHSPQDVQANDRMFLLREIDRLRLALSCIAGFERYWHGDMVALAREVLQHGE